MNETQNLSPFVFWAQDERKIFLKIDLLGVKDYNIEVLPDALAFSCFAMGAQGYNQYAFHVNSYSKLNVNECHTKVLDNSVVIQVDKSLPAWWPRLISQPRKPHWLKIDFDRWQSPDMDLEDEERVGDILKDRNDIFERLQKEEFGYRKEDPRIVYLSCYNFYMYVGFLYVCVVLLMKFLGEGSDFFPKAFETVGTSIFILQIVQYLEVLHPLVGVTKGSPVMPMMQIGGRMFILNMLIFIDINVQREPVVFFLFLAWSGIEIIRYPYYISQLFKKNNRLLTWFRYNAWIIFYPTGFVCELIICYKNIPFLDQTHKWSMEMPNAINFTFDSAMMIRVYILFVTTPGMFALLIHMYKLRQKKFGRKFLKQE